VADKPRIRFGQLTPEQRERDRKLHEEWADDERDESLAEFLERKARAERRRRRWRTAAACESPDRGSSRSARSSRA